MSDVQLITVSEDDGEQRLDRWFKKRFPQVTQGHVEKMCRTGQVRVDSGALQGLRSRRPRPDHPHPAACPKPQPR